MRKKYCVQFYMNSSKRDSVAIGHCRDRAFLMITFYKPNLPKTEMAEVEPNLT